MCSGPWRFWVTGPNGLRRVASIRVRPWPGTAALLILAARARLLMLGVVGIELVGAIVAVGLVRGVIGVLLVGVMILVGARSGRLPLCI